MPRNRYRSNFEKTVAKDLTEQKVKFKYETLKIPYTKECTYTPDFILPNGIIIETKGRFMAADRSKHLRIREQAPEHDIRFIFMNPNVKLSKKSKTTYGEWCDKNGFKWSYGLIPKSWIMEKKK